LLDISQNVLKFLHIILFLPVIMIFWSLLNIFVIKEERYMQSYIAKWLCRQ